MKKSVIILLFAAALLLPSGCQKLGPLVQGNKTAVRFTAVSAAGTKTVYSGAETTEGTKKYERINWVDGDAIRIWSDVATDRISGSNWSDYTVTGTSADPNNPRYSNASLANGSDNGLTWGAAGDYKFHAVYPAQAVSADGATTACRIPDAQTPDFGTTRVGTPDMSYAFMTASATATTTTAGEGVPVRLLFDPAFTAFEVSLASESQTLYLDSFSIQSDGGSPLAGAFTVAFEGAGDSKYLPSAAAGALQSQVSVALNNMVLTPTDGLTFTVLALPEAYNDLSITFNVKVDPTAATPISRTLKLQWSGSYVEFAQCAKHRIYGLALSADNWEVITATGEDLEWDSLYVFGALFDTDVEYVGGTRYMSDAFTSYKTADGGATRTPVPFTLEYSIDGTTWSETPPDWLTPGAIDCTGSTEGQRVSMTATAQTNIAPPDQHHINLLANGSYDTPEDLSTHNVATGAIVSRTTANCYVVDRPGSYKLPLVYGNGVVGGVVNQEAYRARAGVGGGFRPDDGDVHTATTGDTYFLGSFKDHLDNNIYNGGDAKSSPYLTTHLDKAASNFTAVLVWQDKPGLVEVDAAISGTGENSYLTFNVPAETITQGNALVAVLVDGKIAWSWHIWVTEEDLSASQAGYNGYSFAPVNLGWTEGQSLELYEGRACLVRATQSVSGHTTEATFVQRARSVTTGSNNPFYQWGRKDPLQAAEGILNTRTNKTYYPSSAEYAPQNGVTGRQTIGAAIQTPYIHYVGDYLDWCSVDYLNHWNSAYGDILSNAIALTSAITKTIYDPSPVGYKMPPPEAYADFQLAVSSFTEADGIRGRLFSAGLFFPATGFRSHLNATLGSVGNQGNYWSAATVSRGYGYTLRFTPTELLTTSQDRRTLGYSVRPVVE